MQRWQKIAATIWTMLLAAPVLLFLYAYTQLECLEYDPCPTGRGLPYSGLAFVALLLIVGLEALFLRMIWTRPDANRHPGLDPGSTFFTEADQDQRDAGSHPA